MNDLNGSSIFSISQGALLGHLFRLHGRPWLIGCGVVVAALLLVALLLSDIRFAILALMIVFFIIPMVMSLLYFNYALKYDVSFNALPHSLHLTEKGVEVKIFNYKNEVELDSEKMSFDNLSVGNEAETVVDNPPGDNYVLTSTLLYDYDRFSRYDVALKGVFYRILGVEPENGKSKKKSDVIVSAKEDGFLYIPTSAFPSAEDYNNFVRQIAERKRK